MRKLLQHIRRCGLALLAVMLFLFGTAQPAWAANVADLESDRMGSVTLTLADGSGNTVSGGEISIYEVASLYIDNGKVAYAYTEPFRKYRAALDVTDTSLAQTLAQFVADSGVSGTAAAVGTDGTVIFENLELGMYLLVQTADSNEYETISPFVVTVPVDNDGQWEYEVNATPKVVTVTATSSEDPDDPEDSEETDPDEDDSDENDPDEDDSDGDDPDEEDPDDDDSDETDPGGSSGTDTGTSGTGTSTDTALPQTGQLYWPVPLLAACGVLLFALGRVLKNTERKEQTL
ncbi:MAG: hypothetical protein LUF32_02020 [Clostridiales bacterium]|nr:hypothetical protein [Clostridiales bacterium]